MAAPGWGGPVGLLPTVYASTLVNPLRLPFFDVLSAARHEYVLARTESQPSIVLTSILSALEGRFGDHHRTDRTAGSELFINPLMAIYFGFDLAAVARRSLYLPRLAATESIFEVAAIIEAFQGQVAIRPRRAIPH